MTKFESSSDPGFEAFVGLLAEEPAQRFQLKDLSEVSESHDPFKTSMVDRWFTNLDELNKVLGPKRDETENDWPTVRIAVIDSGLSPSYRQRGEITYRNFVEVEDPDKITSEHGTISVDLIQKVFGRRRAKLFVARVFQDNVGDDKLIGYMTQVINYIASWPSLCLLLTVYRLLSGLRATRSTLSASQQTSLPNW